ncbi:hypothetical protein DTO027B5_9064 [Paecilomyces variotii]|nr:hypothetical protein DTO027B3_9033 [Paecilomyces variotii]KAJ9327086.1 hypothetical protein DTO027B5_9064 [Paecilomyces variotii]
MFALLVHWKSHCCMAGVGGEEALLVDISRACFGLILLRPQRITFLGFPLFICVVLYMYFARVALQLEAS